MVEKIIPLLKEYIVIPKLLLKNYKKLNLTEMEIIVLMYLLNDYTFSYNPKKISEELDIDLKEVINLMDDLSEKDVVKIEKKVINNIHTEYISVEPLYNKLAFLVINNEKENDNTNIFDTFEKEFGRTLSPMEYGIINAWSEAGYKDELIIMALKEAIYNGVTHLRYIDKILNDWDKKGIKTVSDIEKNKKEFQNKKETKKDLFEYDWLNDSK